MSINNGYQGMPPKKLPQDHAAQLIYALSTFHPISPEIATYLTGHSVPVSYRKGKLLVKAGTICTHVYFIKKGVVRGFVHEGRNDITTWITAENEMATSISSFDLQTPALENIQSLEDCELLAMKYQDLQNLYTQYPEFNIVGRKVLEKYYRDAEEMAYICRLSSAESRYKHFLKTQSHLANRIPLKYIASYLGLAEETLSRVRKKISLSSPK